MNKPHPLVLASASPRRRELLAQIGVEPVACHSPNIDESARAQESAATMVERLARLKALTAAETLNAEALSDAVVLAADTVVSVDDRILGKPLDRHDFLSAFTTLSNREHQVITGVALRDGGGKLTCVVVETDVCFGPVTRTQAEAYWETGEPLDKAGGYALQGFAARFVEGIRGSYSNVVGLPLYETTRLLRAAGAIND